MTGGIHIARGTNATINGIEIQKCVDLAIDFARGVPFSDGARPSMELVAFRASRVLKRMRTKGYSRDICRDALWATVIDEAQRVRSEVDQSVDQTAVSRHVAGSSPALGAICAHDGDHLLESRDGSLNRESLVRRCALCGEELPLNAEDE